MGKCVVIFITFVTIFVLITGCTPAPAASLLPAAPSCDGSRGGRRSKTAGAEIEPNKPLVVEPRPVGVAESCKVEPNEVKPTEAEPNVPGPAKPEPNEAPPAKPEPNEVKPTNVESAKAEPNKVEPNNIKPVLSEPNQVKLQPAARLAGQPTISFHDKCADILKNYVNDKGMVNYKSLRYKKLELKNLLDEFASLDPNEYNRWPKEDKIAFWINAYNIQMLRIIIDNYPIQGSRFLNPIYGPSSIRHIKGIWSDYKFIVMDEEFTLAEVDRRFLTKEFAEPMVFFAISLASLSGPPLRNEPYYGHKLYQQLEDQTKRFLSNPLLFRIDRENKKVYLSTILQPSWRGKEFISKFGTDKKFKDQEPETRAVLNFITKYLPRQDVDFLEVENYSIKYLRYDWTLNDGS
jgi:hypothetical protein